MKQPPSRENCFCNNHNILGMTEFTTHSLADLDQVAVQLLHYMGHRRKVALYGELGAGKTALVQAFCRHMGVREAVVSPTFSLVNTYVCAGADGRMQEINHLDLYRLNHLQEALDLGIEELIDDDQYCFVEWPELIEPLLPEDTVRIKLEIVNDSTRKVLFL